MPTFKFIEENRSFLLEFEDCKFNTRAKFLDMWYDGFEATSNTNGCIFIKIHSILMKTWNADDSAMKNKFLEFYNP